MADWGAIGSALPLNGGHCARSGAVAASYGGTKQSTVVVTRPGINAATVSGTVTENGSAVAGRTVAALRKRDHYCLGTTTTAANGSYSILCATSEEVYVVAFDPPGFQALVFDRVTPA